MEEFLDQYKEHMEMIGKALENLAERSKRLEEAFSKIPPPGANMVKYKPEGYEEYLNLSQLFDSTTEILLIGFVSTIGQITLIFIEIC